MAAQWMERQLRCRDDETGCAYPLDDDGEQRNCGLPRRLGSPYCADHHALCHVRCGTAEETNRLREVEALANAVGGRRARDGNQPPPRFLKRLAQVVRDFC
jgi:hypothetical protein